MSTYIYRSVLHVTGGVTIAAAAQVPRPQLVGGAVLAASLGLTLVSWLAHSVRTRACSPSSKVSLLYILLQTYILVPQKVPSEGS